MAIRTLVISFTLGIILASVNASVTIFFSNGNPDEKPVTVKGKAEPLKGEGIDPYLTSTSRIVFVGITTTLEVFKEATENHNLLPCLINSSVEEISSQILLPTFGNFVDFVDGNGHRFGSSTVTLYIPLKVKILTATDGEFYEGVACLHDKQIKLYVTSEEKELIAEFLADNLCLNAILEEQPMFPHKEFNVNFDLAKVEGLANYSSGGTDVLNKEVLVLSYGNMSMGST